jgi:hypothetical protein
MQFTFTEQQVNIILQALSQLPYAQSAGMIHEIQAQAQSQLKKAEPKAEVEAEND